MNRRLLATALTLCCLLLLGACGGSSGTSQASAKPSDTTSRGVPSDAIAKTKQGGMHYVEFWVQTLNRATRSGDTARFKTLNAPTCQLCRDFAAKLDGIYGSGGDVKTAGFRVKSVLAEEGAATGTTWSVNLVATPQTLVVKKGATAQRINGGDVRLRMMLERRQGGWLVKNFLAG